MTRIKALFTLQTVAPPGAAVSALQRPVHPPLDSVVVHSPLPDPIVPVVQFLFQQPGWALGLEILVGAAAAGAAAWYMWTRRLWMFGWFRSAPRGAQAMFVGANLALVAIAVGFGGYGYHYTMHDNDFCRGCHIFVPSGQAWVRPDTGNYLLVNALEGKHDTLQCHACHAFQVGAQTKELLLWIADRPQDVPPHGRVAQAVCERCHVQGEASKEWQRIASTAGHAVHLAHDTTAHGGRIQCLTCHARTAHRFQANDSTCAMSGCHTDNTIKLGRMAGQSEMHCTLCHQFNAEPSLHLAADSTRTLLIPGQKQCTACHGMQQLTVSFDFSRDPHLARCGSCHNPHTQTRPPDADSACASCHKDWRTVAFHTGAIHRGVVRPTACTQCHQPHAARVDASDCTGCHREMRQLRGGHREIIPPLPFDTTAALRTSSIPPPERILHGKGDAPLVDDPLPPPAPPADSFSHQRHQRLACLTCHDPRSDRKLTFEPGRGCQICHHQTPDRSNCTACHAGAELDSLRLTTATVAVRGLSPRSRAVAFSHSAHRSQSCVTCHLSPVTLLPPDSVVTCAACHASHAGADTSCTTCHAAAAPFPSHAPPVDAHRGCVACHAGAIVATLTPSRGMCLTCHASQRDHRPEGECSTCHLGATPEAYRAQLTAGRP